MINKKTQKILAILIVAVLTFGMLVPVSAASGSLMEVSENMDFSSYTGAWGSAGGWDVKSANGKVENEKLNSLCTTSNSQIAEYWTKTETYGVQTIVLTLDVQAKNIDEGTILQIYAGDNDNNVNNLNGGSLYNVYLCKDGTLAVNNSPVSTEIKNDAIYNLEMTFDLKAKKVTMRYKKSTDADYAAQSVTVDFAEGKFTAGQALKKFIFWGPKTDGADAAYSIDNVVVSYDTGLIESENQTFDEIAPGGYGIPGKWELKGGGAVTGGKLVPPDATSKIIANYWLKEETFGTDKYVISFDMEASTVNTYSGLLQIYATAGDVSPETEGSNAQQICVLNFDQDNIYVNGTNVKTGAAITTAGTINMKLIIDMNAKNTTLKYKKSADSAYTACSPVANKVVPDGYTPKKILVYSPTMTTANTFSIDNFNIFYKPLETKIQADLTVKDGENEIADINNIPADKNLKVTPVFKNIGNRKADGVVLIVAWYRADGTLKDAFVEIDSAGLAAGATNSDLGDITFTAATEEGDYIKAFAWDSFATLKPYNLVYAE